MFALYPLYYCFRDTILFWRWSKNKEKEWDNIVKRIDKQIEEDMNEKQDKHNWLEFQVDSIELIRVTNDKKIMRLNFRDVNIIEDMKYVHSIDQLNSLFLKYNNIWYFMGSHRVE